jgi:hypothetical protein
MLCGKGSLISLILPLFKTIAVAKIASRDWHTSRARQERF